METSNNPKLCVTLLQQNAHLLHVNCAFSSIASLDFWTIRSTQYLYSIIYNEQN